MRLAISFRITKERMMKKLLIVACFGMMSTPALADTYAEFLPGQYDYTLTMEAMGTVTEENESDCLTEAEKRITAKTIEEQMPGGVTCSYSDVITTGNSVSSTISCYMSDDGITFKGPSLVSWTNTSFDLVVDGVMVLDDFPSLGEVPAKISIKGGRSGVCK